ncbi:MAG: hypothetical protein ACYC7A_22675 [Thermoanaerobaculia bacterium]
MRKTIVAVSILAPIAAGLMCTALFSELGIFLVGYHVWMARAAAATSVASTDSNVRRVLNATQYGVNQAENYVLSVKDRDTRIRLWNRLIALAPNENWRRIYGYGLEAEYGFGPHVKKDAR